MALTSAGLGPRWRSTNEIGVERVVMGGREVRREARMLSRTDSPNREVPAAPAAGEDQAPFWVRYAAAERRLSYCAGSLNRRRIIHPSPYGARFTAAGS